MRLICALLLATLLGGCIFPGHRGPHYRPDDYHRGFGPRGY